MSEFREEPPKEALSPRDRLMRMKSAENLEKLGKPFRDIGKMATAVQRLEALTEQETRPEYIEQNKGYQDKLEQFINQADAGKLDIAEAEEWQQTIDTAYEAMKQRQKQEQVETIRDRAQKLYTLKQRTSEFRMDVVDQIYDLLAQEDYLRKAVENDKLDVAELELWERNVDRLYEQSKARPK